MNGFTGTGCLLRLAIRRDRIRLAIWLVILIGTIFSVVPAVKEMYAQPEMRENYAATMSTSMLGRLYGGLLDGDSLGAVVMVESYAFTATLIAFMSGFLIVRHTRANEESGSMEVLLSGQVGRYAPVAAAMLVAVAANAVLAVATGLFFMQFADFPAASGWLLGLAFAGTGISFAAIATVAAQLASTGRGANALVGATIGAAFVLRAIGDAWAMTRGGEPQSHWLAWLSPIGWGQQIYPFTRQYVWVIGLYVLFLLFMLCMTYLLLRRRDVGSGILQVQSGRPRATLLLKTPLGFAWRMQRSAIIWWTIILTGLGVIYGSMAQEFKDMLDSSDLMRQYVMALGGDGEIVRAFLGAMISVTAVVVAGYVISSALKIRSEETSGRLEGVLATSVNRYTWLLMHVAMILLGVTLMMGALGVSVAVSAALATREALKAMGICEYVIVSLSYLPPLTWCLAVVVLVIGVWPTAAYAVGWGLFLTLLLVNQLGALLKLPDWLMQLSPFYHISSVPSEPTEFTTVLIIKGVAVALLVIGVVAFRRRDIQ